MSGPLDSRPEILDGFRIDGTHLLTVITELIKDKVLDLGGPDIGPTAPFLTQDEWEQVCWPPEMIERVLILYKLQIRSKICQRCHMDNETCGEIGPEDLECILPPDHLGMHQTETIKSCTRMWFGTYKKQVNRQSVYRRKDS